jgi:hypothetical protein
LYIFKKIPKNDSDRSNKPVDSVIGTDSTNTNTNSNSVEMYIICDKNGIIIDISQSVTHTLFFYNEHDLASNSVCILMNKLNAYLHNKCYFQDIIKH